MMNALLYPKAKQGTRRQTEPLHAVHGSLGQITACVANAKHFNDTWKFTGKQHFLFLEMEYWAADLDIFNPSPVIEIFGDRNIQER